MGKNSKFTIYEYKTKIEDITKFCKDNGFNLNSFRATRTKFKKQAEANGKQFNSFIFKNLFIVVN